MGISICFDNITFALEQRIGQRIEGIVAQAGVAHHNSSLKETRNLNLDHHIIYCQYPLACWQLRKFLHDAQCFDKVDVTLTRNGQVATLHLIA